MLKVVGRTYCVRLVLPHTATTLANQGHEGGSSVYLRGWPSLPQTDCSRLLLFNDLPSAKLGKLLHGDLTENIYPPIFT